MYSKQREALTEEMRELVQQDQPVSEDRHWSALQVIKLHGNLVR